MLNDKVPRTIEDYLSLHEKRLNRIERTPVNTGSGTIDPGVTTYAQDNEPGGTIAAGSLWIDTDDDNKIYRWDGTNWVLIRDGGITADQAEVALLLVALQTVEARADNLVTLDYRPAAPITTPHLGDLWTNSVTSETKRWDGTSWIPANATKLGMLLSQPTNLLSVADKRLVTFWQFGAPVATGIGDLWVDIQNNNLIYRWNGTRWASLLATGVAELTDLVSNKITTFREASTAPPLATTTGDLWIVTDMGNLIRRWSGTEWLDAELGTVTSLDYVQSTSGWQFSNETSQVNNLQVVGELGATSVSADDLLIDGTSFMTDFSPSVSRGLVTYVKVGEVERVNSENIGATEVGLVEINAGELEAGRVYVVTYTLSTSLIGANSDSTFVIRIKMTTDGTSPTLADPTIPGHARRFTQTTGAQSTVHHSAPFVVTGTEPTVCRFLVAMERASGTGTAQVLFSEPTNPLKFWIVDGGLASGLEGSVMQRSKLDGSNPDPVPASRHTRVWYATWGQSFRGDLSQRGGETLYQGVNPAGDGFGNQRSLVGFNYQDIQARLNGATINSAKLTFKVMHSGLNAGANIQIGTHTYANPPGAWAGANVTEARFTKINGASGVAYTMTLPAGFINDLASGPTKGVAFGPAAQTGPLGYAYIFGAGSGQAPRLTVTYTK